MRRKVIIVGGVAGGASAAARLRRLDEYAEIILLERGPYISFANCGLPYYAGGVIRDKSALTLQTPESFHARFRVDVRVQSEALRIDRAAKTVEILDRVARDTYVETYDKLILSPGAEPLRPSIPGIDGDRVFPLRTIPDAEHIMEAIARTRAKSAVVLGGGYIGVEMAENLCHAGLAVTLVEMRDQILPTFDGDIACDIAHHMRAKGVSLRLGSAVEALEETDSGLTVTASTGKIEADIAVLALGVRPETGLARDCGLALNERSGIVVDSHMCSSDPDIYAVGDAVEIADFVTGSRAMIPLAGPANKQGRIAADNICGKRSRYQGTQGSAILKVFDMTAAATGLSEKTARRENIPYIKSYTYSAHHAGYYPGAEGMSVKLLLAPDSGKVLGAQLAGRQGVDKRCDVIATVIRLGGTAADLTELELCYAPPYSSAKDPVNMAGYAAQNLLDGLVWNFHWHEVPEIRKDPGSVLLDIRTEGEYAAGHIDGSVHMPLDSLRERLDGLDREKIYCVICQVGLRGYVACRILTQWGFKARNLSGGYRLYQSATAQF